MLDHPSFIGSRYARKHDHGRVHGRRTKVACLKSGRNRLEGNDTFIIACCEGHSRRRLVNQLLSVS